MKSLIIAAIASVVAVTAAAPTFAANDPSKGDPAKKEKRIHRMVKRADLNGDKRISPAELVQALERSFAVLDTNRDGVLSQSELAGRKAAYKAYRVQVKAERNAGNKIAGVVRLPKAVGKHFAKVDANGDGAISKSELKHVAERVFKRRDHNKDGYISAADFNV
ncbi:hypothetical protein JJB09_00125 [Rhizobium sp. KVB221]|uniref:EF-hand domain-containing protein n=1 Tax=Rhizobium setariae TaxID=2801340 RepID=A0A936YPX2_9HYPH|nr:EF-hand domain-containing protein [Rhizobium setariae]MBL0370422.1 hypothetical protein [Rhizobium setariae]